MKKKNSLILLLVILAFVLGFFVHAVFAPSLLSNNYALAIKHAINNKKTLGVSTQSKSLTIVSFEDGEFDPKVVVVGKSYYLSIVNMSETELMTLTSQNPALTTFRGYGKSEELRVQLYDTGEYQVSSREHPRSFLKVIVK